VFYQIPPDRLGNPLATPAPIQKFRVFRVFRGLVRFVLAKSGIQEHITGQRGENAMDNGKFATESLALSAAGGALGLLFGVWSAHALTAFLPTAFLT
jgi:hypothetical protein